MTEKMSLTLARELLDTIRKMDYVIKAGGADWKQRVDALEPTRVAQKRDLMNAIHDEMIANWDGATKSYRTERELRFAFNAEKDRRYRAVMIEAGY